MGEAVGKEYVSRHFPPASKAMMDDLVANLLAAYRQSISKLDWMTDETKQRAFEKLDRFRPKIGYPEKFRDYSRLRVTRDDLLGNVAAGVGVRDRPPARQDRLAGRPRRVVHAAADGERLLQTRARTRSASRPGILQKPFFSPDADPAENYGGIGAVIGTRSATASTTRARSTTAPATSTTGGRRRQGGVRGEVEGADRAVQRLRARELPGRARQRRAHRSARTSATSGG
jgi:hypothetical protein